MLEPGTANAGCSLSMNEEQEENPLSIVFHIPVFTQALLNVPAPSIHTNIPPSCVLLRVQTSLVVKPGLLKPTSGPAPSLLHALLRGYSPGCTPSGARSPWQTLLQKLPDPAAPLLPLVGIPRAQPLPPDRHQRPSQVYSTRTTAHLSKSAQNPVLNTPRAAPCPPRWPGDVRGPLGCWSSRGSALGTLPPRSPPVLLPFPSRSPPVPAGSRRFPARPRSIRQSRGREGQERPRPHRSAAAGAALVERSWEGREAHGARSSCSQRLRGQQRLSAPCRGWGAAARGRAGTGAQRLGMSRGTALALALLGGPSAAPGTAGDTRALPVKRSGKTGLKLSRARGHRRAPSPALGGFASLILIARAKAGSAPGFSGHVGGSNTTELCFPDTFHPRDLKPLLQRPGINPDCLPRSWRRTGALCSLVAGEGVTPGQGQSRSCCCC